MAETTTTTPAEQQPATTPNYDEIFSKLDAILDKRADGLAKSALKDNGVEESEIADIVKAYREQKQTKANEQATALSDAQKTIADLQKQIADRALDDAFSTAALELSELSILGRVSNVLAMRAKKREKILTFPLI